MPQFCLYRQQREDGGFRTGLEVESSSVWQSFEAGPGEDRDPALRWYVDLRGEGDDIPTNRDELRDWLLEHAEPIQAAFHHLADRFQVGLDVEVWPTHWEVPNAPPGFTLEIVISATRRTDALEIARVLQEMATSWPHLINRIPRTIPV